jgi:hypothetical protein
MIISAITLILKSILRDINITYLSQLSHACFLLGTSFCTRSLPVDLCLFISSGLLQSSTWQCNKCLD